MHQQRTRSFHGRRGVLIPLPSVQTIVTQRSTIASEASNPPAFPDPSLGQLERSVTWEAIRSVILLDYTWSRTRMTDALRGDGPETSTKRRRDVWWCYWPDRFPSLCFVFHYVCEFVHFFHRAPIFVLRSSDILPMPLESWWQSRNERTKCSITRKEVCGLRSWGYILTKVLILSKSPYMLISWSQDFRPCRQKNSLTLHHLEWLGNPDRMLHLISPEVCIAHFLQWWTCVLWMVGCISSNYYITSLWIDSISSEWTPSRTLILCFSIRVLPRVENRGSLAG